VPFAIQAKEIHKICITNRNVIIKDPLSCTDNSSIPQQPDEIRAILLIHLAVNSTAHIVQTMRFEHGSQLRTVIRRHAVLEMEVEDMSARLPLILE
jgi:hypothetical protein